MKEFDQEAYDKQRAADRAETERLKALWAAENAVDKGARREAAAKAAAEKEARETPSAEDQARGKEIFDAVYHRWKDPHRHRLLLADDEKTILKHVFTLWITHPFRKCAHEHFITLPADKFTNDKQWCVHTVDLNLSQQWLQILDEEADTQRDHVKYVKDALKKYEKRAATPEPEPEPVDFTKFAGLQVLKVGFEVKDMISVEVVSIDPKTGDLRLLVTDHGVDHKHVLAGKEYTFRLNTSWAGNYNLWLLREEEDESWDGHGTGADYILVYDKGTWLFDLDS